jgi:hypothetical protein
MAKNKPEDELEILFPDRTLILKDGRSISVYPFKFKDFKEVLEIARKYVGIASEEGDLVQKVLDRGDEGIDDIAALIDLGSSVTPDQVGELDGDEAIDLFYKVIEVNADFFVRKLTEGALKVAARINPTASVSKSPDSSGTDIDGEISETTVKPS